MSFCGACGAICPQGLPIMPMPISRVQGGGRRRGLAQGIATSTERTGPAAARAAGRVCGSCGIQPDAVGRCSRGVCEAPGGNYLYYGVREFAMAAIMNGVALHGGFIPYGATFLIFMEYARNAVRMSALMGQRVLYVFTHDSIGLGEDGPTHQPVEQLTALRATPNLHTWRPCDTVESAVAWKQALLRESGPAAMIFSRQTLPAQVEDAEQLAGVHRGGYVLVREQGELDAIIIATGSEVALAVAAAEHLSAAGRGVRVVSMPCTQVFDAQEAGYREAVLPSDVLARVAVEAGHADFWYKYVGLDGRVIGMSSFGESAPAPALFEHFGLTADNVVAAVEDVMLD